MLQSFFCRPSRIQWILLNPSETWYSHGLISSPVSPALIWGEKSRSRIGVVGPNAKSWSQCRFVLQHEFQISRRPVDRKIVTELMYHYYKYNQLCSLYNKSHLIIDRFKHHMNYLGKTLDWCSQKGGPGTRLRGCRLQISVERGGKPCKWVKKGYAEAMKVDEFQGFGWFSFPAAERHKRLKTHSKRGSCRKAGLSSKWLLMRSIESFL